jgi:predicted signal transduction protein with EAL and GGDEF domain
VLGDHVGDEVVRLAALRIGDVADGSGIVARWDGDEFLVVSVGAEASLRALHQRLVEALTPMYLVDGREVAVESKVAIVVGALDSAVDDLFADVATELADVRARRLSAASSSSPAVAERRLVVEQLQRAVDVGELASWFQPVVDPEGEIVAFESLLRWDHPTRGQQGRSTGAAAGSCIRR